MPRPACFLDRHDLERMLEDDQGGVAAQLARLRDAGFAVVAATNEPSVASGVRTERDVQEADRLLAATLAREASSSPIDRFYWCPFAPDAAVDRYRFDHPWRKPRPGMLLQAAQDLELDLDRSWMIAGREEDLAAARVAGMRMAALRTIGDDRSGLDLAAAVDAVLASTSEAGSTDPAATEVTEIADVPELEPEVEPEVEVEVEVEVGVLEREPALAVEAAAPARLSGAAPPIASKPPASGPHRLDASAKSSTPLEGATPVAPSRPQRRSDPRSTPRSEAIGAGAVRSGDAKRDESLLAAIRDLTEELRQSRAGARELSGGRVVALILELCVLLAAAMGLMQLADPMLFAKWFLGAVLLQLAAIALLLFDRR